MDTQFQEWLWRKHFCNPERDWMECRSPREAWETVGRADWLFRLAISAGVSQRLLAKAAVAALRPLADMQRVSPVYWAVVSAWVDSPCEETQRKVVAEAEAAGHWTWAHPAARATVCGDALGDVGWAYAAESLARDDADHLRMCSAIRDVIPFPDALAGM